MDTVPGYVTVAFLKRSGNAIKVAFMTMGTAAALIIMAENDRLAWMIESML